MKWQLVCDGGGEWREKREGGCVQMTWLRGATSGVQGGGRTSLNECTEVTLPLSKHPLFPDQCGMVKGEH